MNIAPRRLHVRNNITIPQRPTLWMETQYGGLNYREWLEREQQRFAAHGKATHIAELRDGRIYLAVGAGPAKSQ